MAKKQVEGSRGVTTVIITKNNSSYIKPKRLPQSMRAYINRLNAAAMKSNEERVNALQLHIICN